MKNRKRPRSWHRTSDDRRFRRAKKLLPDTGEKPEQWGEPQRLQRNGTQRPKKEKP